MQDSSHLSESQLVNRLQQVLLVVEVGAKYMHYSQKLYTVIDVAINEANNEPCVIYQADYGKRITFIRPLTVWAEHVLVGGKEVPRFAKIDT